MDSATVTLRGDNSDLQAKLDSSLGTLQEWGGKVASVGKLVIGAFAAQKVFGFVGDLVSSAMEAEDNARLLDQQIKNLGVSASMTADQVKDVAADLQKFTRFTDDAAIKAQTLFLRLGTLDSQGIKRATVAAADLATVMGTDLEAASTKIMTAMKDPERGIMALRQAGIKFTDSEKEMIKALSEAGKEAQAQEIILAKLEAAIGGSAKAAGETAAGQMEIFKNRLSEVGEVIGGELLQAFATLMPSLDAFATWMESTGGPALTKFLSGAMSGIKNIAGLIAGTKEITGFDANEFRFTTAETTPDVVNQPRSKEDEALEQLARKKRELWDAERKAEAELSASATANEAARLKALQEYALHQQKQREAESKALSAKLDEVTRIEQAMQGELDTFGMSSRDKEIKKAQSLFPDDKSITRDLTKIADKLSLKESLQQMKETGDAITESFKSPLQQYKDRISELNSLLANKNITDETFNAAQKDTLEKYGKILQETDKKTENKSVGMFEDLVSLNKRISQAAFGNAPDEPMVRAIRELKQQEQFNGVEQGRRDGDLLRETQDMSGTMSQMRMAVEKMQPGFAP